MSDIISPGVRGYLDGQAEAAGRIADLERRLTEYEDRLRHALADNDYLEAKLAESICSVCAGVPLASGRGCICGGKGTHDAEVVGLRMGYLELETKLAEAQAALAPFGGTCSKCGFRYWEYQGHIIPCPRCERDALKAAVEGAREAVLTIEQARVLAGHDSPQVGLWVQVGTAVRRALAALNAGKEAPGLPYTVCDHCEGAVAPGGSCIYCACLDARKRAGG